MTDAFQVKGWCPGALRPMVSGDGLIVRVRPFCGRLEPEQVLGLCELAQAQGNGMIDLTNRANLQLRGIAETGYDAVLTALGDLGLLDATPLLETRRNLIVTPFWQGGDLTQQIARDLGGSLKDLPDLPAKFGFAVDTGAQPLLRAASADVRIERAADGVLVRADGALRGRVVAVPNVAEAALELAQWFAQSRTPEERRMAALVQRMGAPTGATVPALSAGARPVVGKTPFGPLLGVAFGQIDAQALAVLFAQGKATGLRMTPWRMLLLEGGEAVDGCGFLSDPASPLLEVHACPGAPSCTSASVQTRSLAQQLAGQLPGRVHVSGCAKGCALAGQADLVLIGRDGRFDLVRGGHAWDAPDQTGLRPQDILAEVNNLP